MNNREADAIETHINCIKGNYDMARQLGDRVELLEAAASYAEEVRERLHKVIAKAKAKAR